LNQRFIFSRSFSPVPAFGGSLERRTAEISDAVEETEPETGDVEYARIRQASNATCENTFISPPLEIAVNAPTLPVEEDSFLQEKLMHNCQLLLIDLAYTFLV
jgi:hypothetical protein